MNCQSLDELRTRLEQDREAIERLLAAPTGFGGDGDPGTAHALFLAWQKINDAIALLSQASMPAAAPVHGPSESPRRPKIAERIAPIGGAAIEASPVNPAIVDVERTSVDSDLSRAADDLTRIRRIDLALADKLRSAGVSTFERMAMFSPADVQRLSAEFDLGRRVCVENWIEQAALLMEPAKQPTGKQHEQPVPLPAPSLDDAAGRQHIHGLISQAALRILAGIPERSGDAAEAECADRQVWGIALPVEQPEPMIEQVGVVDVGPPDLAVALDCAGSDDLAPPAVLIGRSLSSETDVKLGAVEVLEAAPDEVTLEIFEDDFDANTDEAEITIVARPRTANSTSSAAPAPAQSEYNDEDHRTGEVSAPDEFRDERLEEDWDHGGRVRDGQAVPRSVADYSTESYPVAAGAGWDEADVVIVPRQEVEDLPIRKRRVGKNAAAVPQSQFGTQHTSVNPGLGREPTGADGRIPSRGAVELASVDITLRARVNTDQGQKDLIQGAKADKPAEAKLSRFLKALRGK